MLIERERALPHDALDQLAHRLLAEARSQYTQKPLDRSPGSLSDDVGTNLLAWLLDTYDDALTEHEDE